ncbi:protein SENSITIVE TO PROTON RHIZOTOXICITY 1 [Daucus carota subsp. sativus]|uniref:C2H2-type domain-containing protein n=2 Tax=Daucus carota subsp. sativus TaxID=79200 RepID=A0A164UY59_DAUCS|nr:PREDICTED: protein SENSITIVE TO PROTON RHIZOTOXICITY 1-like [Daucus carota subsp. sativus]
MDLQKRLCGVETWTKLPSSTQLELQKKVPPDQHSFINFSSQGNVQKWNDPSIIDYSTRIGEQFPEFVQPSQTQCTYPCNNDNQMNILGQLDGQMNGIRDAIRNCDWDPRVMLTNLSIMEQKIHQLQDLVHIIFGRRTEAMNGSEALAAQQQQLINADLTSIIVQLISTAGSLLPSSKNTFSSGNPFGNGLGQPGGIGYPSGPSGTVNNHVNKVEDHSDQIDLIVNNVEDHDLKDEEEVDEGEHLPPGSYEILQLEKEEILAPHTHFCLICGKGFKRDANLRMHMRGHGDEYKTPAALAKPHKEMSSEPSLVKRYSCPYIGCKRNKDHKKFQPLKTILCVKNHYKRTHCDKSYTCSRCNTKKFSVIADLKTHEKHCGRDKWLCSCGTTFSRKDKLFGHITLFQGHTPAIPLDENKGMVELSDHGEANETPSKVARTDFDFSPAAFLNIMDAKGTADEDTRIFSPLDFDISSLSGFSDFPRPPFEDSDNSLSFLIPSACNYPRGTERNPGSNNLK